MLNRRLLVYTSGGEVEAVLTFIVKDKETGAGIANAYVYLRDGNHQMLMQLGITDSSGRIYTYTSRNGDILETLTMIALNYYIQTKNTKLKFLCTLTVFVEF